MTDNKGKADNKTISLINSNLKIKGEMISNIGNVEVLGEIEGNLNIDNLTIHETGFIKGEITCKTLILKGRIEGNVNGKTVRIKSTGIINGNISYETLSIEDDACINGSCSKNDKVKNENK